MEKFKLVWQDRKSILMASHPIYGLSYKKNTVVVAPKGSLGLMTFDDIKSLEIFLNRLTTRDLIPISIKGVTKAWQLDKPIVKYRRILAIRVEPIGRRKVVYRIPVVSFEEYDYLERFYALKVKDRILWARTVEPYPGAISFVNVPRGTSCYPQVRVLE